MICDVCKDTFGRMLDSSEKRFTHHPSYTSLARSGADDCFICSEIIESITKSDPKIVPYSPRPLTTWGYHPYGDRRTSTEFWVWLDRCDPSNSLQYSSDATSYCVHIYDATPVVSSTPCSTAFSNDTGSVETTSQIVNWLERCTTDHDLCNQGREGTWMPSRLLEINEIHGDLRLHLRDRSQLDWGRYCTLSHCWGPSGTQKLKLTTESLKSLHDGVSVSKLKPTFRDMVTVMRRLGVCLIWIDCLCIVQDDTEDWKRESASMGKIYANSWLNISANAGRDGNAGLFVKRDGESLVDYFSMQSDENGEEVLFAITEAETWWHQVEVSPVNRRAWVLQERILSPRILHMSSKLALWECRQLQASEVFPNDGLPDQESPNNYGHIKRLCHGSQSQDQADISADWWRLVHRYTMCALTFETDKLIALSGIASEIHKRTQCEYLAGLWSSTLPSSLLWVVTSPPGLRSPTYVAPSWSWASATCTVESPQYVPEHPNHVGASIIGHEIALANPRDMFGQVTAASIGVRSRLGTLDWIIEIGRQESTGWDYRITEVTISLPGVLDNSHTIAKWSSINPESLVLFFDYREYEDTQRAPFAVMRSQIVLSEDETTITGYNVQGLLLKRLPCSRYVRIGVALLEFDTEQDFLSKMPEQDVIII
ncbi:heterokaryon incompatibility protein-domain-containing protein [Alternaria rosae]|uniref:heterokaryon incompatibility protein-domain-containing protein n=1 Tax=Alternaria rosae TaxID=1187941 RepID=UPI001E8E4FE1|nr:heterokaryon incompatibility protein-domain-containing protein [Alternaria rosae]KAH6881297.1 heterokaryon incompatibility protein-domain-containing protein [Alternaria rosae]